MTSVMYRHDLGMTWVTGTCREPLGNPPYPVLARQIEEHPVLFKGLAHLAVSKRRASLTQHCSTFPSRLRPVSMCRCACTHSQLCCFLWKFPSFL